MVAAKKIDPFALAEVVVAHEKSLFSMSAPTTKLDKVVAVEKSFFRVDVARGVVVFSDGDVIFAHRGGKTIKLVESSYPNAFLLDGDTLFFAAGDEARSIAVSGGAPVVVGKLSKWATTFAVDDTHLVASGGSGDVDVEIVAKSGGRVTKLANARHVNALALSKDAVVFHSEKEKALLSVGRSGGAAVKITPKIGGKCDSLHADDAAILFSARDGLSGGPTSPTTIFSLTPGAKKPTPLSQFAQLRAMHTDVDGLVLLVEITWQALPDDHPKVLLVLRTDRDGKNERILARVEGDGADAHRLFVDGNDIHLADDKTVWRLAR
jgi:hypothetical protein